jgi:DNA-binding response OmpR family regulator
LSPETKLSPEEVAELRHDLRTPVNLIVGYCEMLLEDATEPDLAERKTALEDALAAVRDALAVIDTTVPATKDDLRTTDVVQLHESLRDPQSRILHAVTVLMGTDTSSTDEGFVADLMRVRAAAEQLVEIGQRTKDAPEATSEASSESGSADDSNRSRILVVDDIEDNRDILERRLRKQGHQVDSADGGQAAVDLINERGYDLVLLDVMMPEVDGFQVLQHIKGTPETSDIPVIMISALDDMASIVRCIELGAEDYLPKPFDSVLLRARIAASLERKRLRDTELEYLSQVDTVIAAASAVERGAYESQLLSGVAARSDKLGRLARVFDSMAAKVRSREQRLQNQVDALRADVESASSGSPRADDEGEAGGLKAGDVIAGRYDVTGILGRGGMGSVYKARDRELDEDIAVKVLRPGLVSSPSLVDRFKTELRLTRRISHRNVVRTYDLGESDGAYYITMEYVEGVTARELIDTRGVVGVSSTLAIAAQLAEALGVAHERGVIHRDIKPQNLLLDGDGVLKVMDFGVARLAERTDGVTETGMVVGTPAYMAPEQLLDEDVDARSDLYAVGVVLYECLTGRLPFEANSPVALIAKLLRDDPIAPASLQDGIPPALSSLILRLLAKGPAERVGSALELQQRLARIDDTPAGDD